MLHRIYQPQQCQRNEEREKRFLRKKQNPNKHQQTADKLSPTRQSYDGRQGQRKRRHVQGVHLKQPIYRRRMKMQALRRPRTKDDKAWGNLSSSCTISPLQPRISENADCPDWLRQGLTLSRDWNHASKATKLIQESVNVIPHTEPVLGTAKAFFSWESIIIYISDILAAVARANRKTNFSFTLLSGAKERV